MEHFSEVKPEQARLRVPVQIKTLMAAVAAVAAAVITEVRADWRQ